MIMLVTGATGTIGRQVVDQLVQAGQHVRALTRNPAKANLPNGVELITGDLAAPHTLARALDGVTGMHLINFDSGSGGPLQTGPQLVDMAIEAGVQRVTVLLGGEKGPLEQAVEASRLEWTLLQPVEFMANMLEWVESIQAEGVVRVPFGDRRTAIVHEADIGAVAATVLTKGGYGGKTLTLTGPEVLTPREMVRAIGAASGREVRFIELTEAQARERWRAAGYPDEVISSSSGHTATRPKSGTRWSRLSNRSQAGHHAPLPNGPPSMPMPSAHERVMLSFVCRRDYSLSDNDLDCLRRVGVGFKGRAALPLPLPFPILFLKDYSTARHKLAHSFSSRSSRRYEDHEDSTATCISPLRGLPPFVIFVVKLLVY